ncbi:unnamed protein product [Bursaphelenchus okinawaensis]|uniref:Uncharacterized protein n=1 Tax=Bursaphelenchus okinawaensis TaxID=465554 RepID=A0A811K866_9BILA|nr:unnamed protein product [Bursaphelenchus okinawaensis]CAG9092936.1 unnamed protein product [Bursaphelenchus okinawaensis]
MSFDPNYSCHGAFFNLSMGYYISCRAHYHCYGSREPPNWCLRRSSYNWTQWGCHCDLKIGSCLVERFEGKTEKLEWSYCVPNEEFYCAGEVPR